MSWGSTLLGVLVGLQSADVEGFRGFGLSIAGFAALCAVPRSCSRVALRARV
jgi:hypothetical protein